jgi:PAB-dependent poly(A)-specific ribonuclease subunit 2
VSFRHLERPLANDPPRVDIYVPPERVIDTVDLYFLRERQRRLSLRFLSWFVLHENIQTDTHDSIEDARSALMLYTAYQDFEAQEILDEKLDELYREGRKHVGSHSHRSCSQHSHTSYRTGNRQPQLGRSPHHPRCPPLLKLHHSRMPFLACVVA